MEPLQAHRPVPGGWSGSWRGVCVLTGHLWLRMKPLRGARVRCRRRPVCPPAGRKRSSHYQRGGRREDCLHISEVLHKYKADLQQYQLPGCNFTPFGRFQKDEESSGEGNRLLSARVGQAQILPRSYRWTVYILLTTLGELL